MEDHHKELAKYEAKRKIFKRSLFFVFFMPIVSLTYLICPFIFTEMAQDTRLVCWVAAAVEFIVSALFIRGHLQEYGFCGPLLIDEKRGYLMRRADHC